MNAKAATQRQAAGGRLHWAAISVGTLSLFRKRTLAAAQEIGGLGSKWTLSLSQNLRGFQRSEHRTDLTPVIGHAAIDALCRPRYVWAKGVADATVSIHHRR